MKHKVIITKELSKTMRNASTFLRTKHSLESSATTDLVISLFEEEFRVKIDRHPLHLITFTNEQDYMWFLLRWS
jgi:hypothetical protein